MPKNVQQKLVHSWRPVHYAISHAKILEPLLSFRICFHKTLPICKEHTAQVCFRKITSAMLELRFDLRTRILFAAVNPFFSTIRKKQTKTKSSAKKQMSGFAFYFCDILVCILTAELASQANSRSYEKERCQTHPCQTPIVESPRQYRVR